MNNNKHNNAKKGVAMFMVLFIMMFLGIMFIAFYSNSQHAQRTAHKFQTSEVARQLAATAQEEAYIYLYKQTDNPDGKQNSDEFMKIITKASSIDASSVGLDQRKSINGLKLKTPETEKMAEAILPGIMEISAIARIVDFKEESFYGKDNYKTSGYQGDDNAKEGIGTIEIAVTVNAKDQYKKKFPGACTIIRHHDYKVSSILSKKENRENKYSPNSFLDYVLFLREGQQEFENYNGETINVKNKSLEIDAQANESSEIFGRINLGSYGNNYQYLNLSTDTIDFINTGKELTEITELKADDNMVDQFFPDFKETLISKGKDDGADSVTVRGHKAVFKFYRKPVINDFFTNTTATETNARIDAALDKTNSTNRYKNIPFESGSSEDYKLKVYKGLSIKPLDKLNNIFDSDVRMQFINFGYFYLDLTDCYITAKADGKSKTAHVISDAPEELENAKNNIIHCFNPKTYKRYLEDKNNDYFKNHLKIEKLAEYINSKGPEIASKAFTYISDDYAYNKDESLEHYKNNDKFFRPQEVKNSPREAYNPYCFINFWNKRDLRASDLESLGIYDRSKKILNLRGIVHCLEQVSLDGLEIRGSGVLIASGGLIINGPIKKANPESVCVLYARDGDITVKTDGKIEAALIALSFYNSSPSSLRVPNNTLNLKGCLITDVLSLNTSNWKPDVEHKIKYDEALISNKDIFQINMARWVTFERVIESEVIE